MNEWKTAGFGRKTEEIFLMFQFDWIKARDAYKYSIKSMQGQMHRTIFVFLFNSYCTKPPFTRQISNHKWFPPNAAFHQAFISQQDISLNSHPPKYERKILINNHFKIHLLHTRRKTHRSLILFASNKQNTREKKVLWAP